MSNLKVEQQLDENNNQEIDTGKVVKVVIEKHVIGKQKHNFKTF